MVSKKKNNPKFCSLFQTTTSPPPPPCRTCDALFGTKISLLISIFTASETDFKHGFYYSILFLTTKNNVYIFLSVAQLHSLYLHVCTFACLHILFHILILYQLPIKILIPLVTYSGVMVQYSLSLQPDDVTILTRRWYLNISAQQQL
jgi:hypothetical protein